VVALALAGEADYLFTFDRGYLRPALAEHNIKVQSPDVFLSSSSMRKQPPSKLSSLSKLPSGAKQASLSMN
jgi:hypothetical protein